MLLKLFSCMVLPTMIGTAPDPSPAPEELRPLPDLPVHAISYGPHRDGQEPGILDPSREEIREDLHLLARHWKAIRVYGARGPAEDILEVIREDDLDLQVMLGAWIAVEERETDDGVEYDAAARAGNEAEVAAAIDLANRFPDVVTTVSVGNETQVYWSWHRSPLEVLLKYVRQVRAAVEQPVTSADDYNYWNKPESRELAAELDFLTLHAHPLWNGLQLEDAVEWTAAQLDSVRTLHPGRDWVIGETGWATMAHDEGEQGELIRGAFGEEEQRIFHEGIRAWAEETGTTVYFFEAFDEKWKGGPHPHEVEKHWGLFFSDRSPKAAMREPQPSEGR